MSEIFDDLKNMTISVTGNFIAIDMREYKHCCSAKIALLNVIRLQSDIKDGQNVNLVEVIITEKDTRRFKIPSHVDGVILKGNIFKDKALHSFLSMQ